MTSKMFLTSVAAVMLAMPAMAEPWPSNDIMLENKTYDNAATEEHMLVSADGATANATADYEAQKYSAAPGRYIPANLGYDEETTTAECTAGNYCPGLTDVEYKATAQGLNACPDGYASSAAGASAANQCYKACTTDMVAHATGVKGNDYYADGADTCEPTSCAAGWHIKEGQSLNLAETIGTKGGSNSAYISNNGSFGDSGSDFGAAVPQSFWNFGAEDKNVWGVNFGDSGIVKGMGRCSTQSGNGYPYNNPTIKETLEDETGTGRYCWCNVTSYTPKGGSEMSLSSSWVFNADNYSADNCASRCAFDCADDVRDDLAAILPFRVALFGSVSAPAALSTCAANTINIQWDGIDEPTTVTYGGDITTPVSAEKRPGQRFKGWKFTTPTTTGD